MKKIKLFEHTSMGDRETFLSLDVSDGGVAGTANVDSMPGKREIVEIAEGVSEGTNISFLITLGNMPRRYRIAINGNQVSGDVTFEGDSELAGIVMPCDGEIM